MERFKYFLISLVCTVALYSNAQHVNIEWFHQEDGLPNDLVKSFEKDSLGFIWVATDDGLVKIEGKNFIYVQTPSMFSNNFKNVLITKKYGILATADAGLLQISEDYDGIQSTYFSENFPGHVAPSLLYPKTLYESHSGSVWVADLKKVYKIGNEGYEVFNFPEKTYTDHFSRSFQFLEVDDNLFVISQTGFLFKFLKNENRFDPMNWSYPGNGVYDIYKLSKNEFLIGCEEGLCRVLFNKDGSIKEHVNLNFPHSVSVIKKLKDKIIVGTWTAGAYEIELSGNDLIFKQVKGSENLVVNDIVFDNDDQLWLGTDMGIMMCRYSVFDEPYKKWAHNYIQDIRKADYGNFYFSNGQRVYHVNKDGDISVFFESKNGLVISLEVDELGVWMASNNGMLYHKKFNGELNEFDFSLEGDGIYNLEIDKESNVWLIQARPNKETLLKIDKNGNVLDLTPDLPDGERVRSLIMGNSGSLYIGATSTQNYLFKYNYNSKKIENISFPIELINNNTMSVIDLIELDEKHLLLATRLGLWELSNAGIKQLDLGDMSNEMVSAIVAENKDCFWFSNSNGIVKYTSESVTVFDNSDGLPAKTVNYRNLVVAEDGKLLAGTISGLAVGAVQKSEGKTPVPIISSFEKTGMPSSLTPNSFVQNSLLYFKFATPVYPAKYVHYQYKLIKNKQETDWIDFKGYADNLVFNDLENGSYLLKVRSKNKGNFLWSNSVDYEFDIYKVWYTRPEILAIIYLTVFLLVWIYTRYNKAKNEQEKKRLEAIIERRTADLRDQNEELKTLNANLKMAKDQADEAIATKDRFFSILAHDLKSPFNTIIGFSELLMESRENLDKELIDKMFGELHKTSENTYKLLQNLLDWARSQTGSLKIQKVCINLPHFVEEITPTLETMATNKKITVNYEVQHDATMFVDKDMLSTVVRNLVSNAIKYSHSGSVVDVRAFQSNGIATFSVEDQGVGINKEKLNELFGIGDNTSTPGTDNEEGTGLGLVLCKEFVEKNNGTIKVESKVNIGSKFVIELPSDNFK